MPQTKSWAELGFEGVPETAPVAADAEAWLSGLTPAELDQLLTKRGAAAYRAGQWPTDQWTTRKTNDQWRDSYVAAKPPGGSR